MKGKVIGILSGIIALLVAGCVIAALAATVKKQKEEIAGLEAAVQKSEAEKAALIKTAGEYKKINEAYEKQKPAAADVLSPAAVDDFNRLFDVWLSDGED